jgi:hypothetical protein
MPVLFSRKIALTIVPQHTILIQCINYLHHVSRRVRATNQAAKLFQSCGARINDNLVGLPGCRNGGLGAVDHRYRTHDLCPLRCVRETHGGQSGSRTSEIRGQFAGLFSTRWGFCIT